MLNTQSISKSEHIDTGLLQLHHLFLTIQGEGPFAGTPAVFVRLFGCNLQCPLCDTDYTSSLVNVAPQFLVDEAKIFFQNKPGLIVFSGGEPFRQNITPAVKALLAAGFKVQIETNGTLPPPPDLPVEEITIVCSPKTGSINKKLAPAISALKYVVHADQVDPADGLPLKALDHRAAPCTAKPPAEFTGDIFIQPIDVENELENKRHLDAAIRSSLRYGYRLCIQIHKVVNME